MHLANFFSFLLLYHKGTQLVCVGNGYKQARPFASTLHHKQTASNKYVLLFTKYIYTFFFIFLFVCVCVNCVIRCREPCLIASLLSFPQYWA